MKTHCRPFTSMLLAIIAIAATTRAEMQTIRNDVFWKTTDGNLIYSQGGGVIKVGDTWYWYGVKYNGAITYAANPTSKNDDWGFKGVTCYSSKDLVNWKDEGLAVQPNQAGGWVGRVGVVYNANTKQYVLAGQGNGGEYFAYGPAPDGPFKTSGTQTEMPFFVNGGTGDQTTFQDDDGKAYVICSNVKGRSNLYVAPLRASDYLQIDPNPTRVYRGTAREGNAMFKYDGTYYFCSSDLHGWNTSQTYCISSKNILGPYGSEFVLDGTQNDFSHVTQTGFFITVKGTKNSFVIFAGDRWSDFAGNGIGYNQWMPITFENGKPRFRSYSEWKFDAITGEWAVGEGNNWVLNPSFEADRVSQTSLTGWKVSPVDASNINSTSQRKTGRWGAYITGAKTLSQTITELPNGTYALSVWVKSSGAGQIFAKGFGGGDLSTNVSAASDWTKKTITGIKVTNGTMQVGVQSSNGQWLAVDDFELKRSETPAVGIRNELRKASSPESGWTKVHSRASFQIEGASEGATLEIRRLDGRPAGSMHAQGSWLSLRDQGLPEGIYLVRRAK